MSTKEGETYTGFMTNINGTCIIGNKEFLIPEGVKTLKIGVSLAL
ncbi:hypothetical protein [Bartonella birtlesii]|nr:hypothetical protein [Bartonella birtlesii]